MNVKDNFIKIDKEFYNNLTSKEILVLLYLYNKSLNLEYFNFTLKDLITSYGYKLNSRKNQVNQLFIQAILNLVDKNIIYLTSSPIKNINQLISGCFCKDQKGRTYFDNLDQFIVCYTSEIQKLCVASVKNITTCSLEKIIQVYLYLKKFIYTIKQMHYCYPSLNKIVTDLNISKPTIIKALNDLETLGLIHKITMGNYINKQGKTCVCTNVYCFKDYSIDEIKQDVSLSLYDFYKWEN